MSAAPEVTLIAAMDRNRLIGANGGMPWHVPGDLRWFRQQTLHRPVLMGRRTFESIGKALPKRRNLVLTRNPAFAAAGVERVADLETAITIAGADDALELAVIGGAEIYALALAHATCLKLTRIDAQYAGDTFFPAFDEREWRTTDVQGVAAEGDTPAHRFMILRRLRGVPANSDGP